MDEVIRRTAGEMRVRLFDRLADKPPEARAEVALKRYLSALHRDEHARGCPMPSSRCLTVGACALAARSRSASSVASAWRLSSSHQSWASLRLHV